MMMEMLIRDMRIGLRDGGGEMIGIMLLIEVIYVMKLGVGNEIKIMERIGKEMIWIGEILEKIIGIERMFKEDREDG